MKKQNKNIYLIYWKHKKTKQKYLFNLLKTWKNKTKIFIYLKT